MYCHSRSLFDDFFLVFTLCGGMSFDRSCGPWLELVDQEKCGHSASSLPGQDLSSTPEYKLPGAIPKMVSIGFTHDHAPVHDCAIPTDKNQPPHFSGFLSFGHTYFGISSQIANT